MTGVKLSGSSDPAKKWIGRPVIDGSKHRVYGRTKDEAQRRVVELKDAAHRRRLGLADPLVARVDLTHDDPLREGA